ncbi:MAG: hypothetical protein JXA69_13905 [Phycisphaerae bacterium]|nr:hypothetical protein [Phycisphaerae bacterium]
MFHRILMRLTVLALSIAVVSACSAPPPPATNPPEDTTSPPTLAHIRTVEMNVGTHRPEILVTADGHIVVAVVEPGAQDDPAGKVKHRAYLFDSDFAAMGESFVLTRITDEFGEPADHRATLVNGELVVVYQTLTYADGVAPVGGPAETYAETQSLMLTRFGLDGTEQFRGAIVAGATDFTADNFPDHCLVWHDDLNRLLVSTGTTGAALKLREVDLNASVLATHSYATSETGVQGVIGNSLLYNAGKLLLFSATGPAPGAPRLAATAILADFTLGSTLTATVADREQSFPTGNLAYGDFVFVGYISRPAGGDVAMESNPYYPYLKILDGESLEVVADVAVGDGSAGFSHTHPTLATLGSRLFVAWSRRDASGISPQVVIDEYQITQP